MTLPGPVLITGATGFAGSHLVELLAGTGRVAGWGRSAPRPELARLAEWTAIDLLDRENVQREIASLRPSGAFVAGRCSAWLARYERRIDASIVSRMPGAYS